MCTEDWKKYLVLRNPVVDLFAGKNPKEIPSMPICTDIPSLPFQARRIVERWIERLNASGSKTITIEWQDYVQTRVEVFKEIFEYFTPAPSWFNTPIQASQKGLSGSMIQLKGEDIYHITADGHEINMGNIHHPKSQDILHGTARDVQITWDSTLGWKSFKDNPAWDPPMNRVEEFKKGIIYKIYKDPDTKALDKGPELSEGPESWIPAGSMGGRKVLREICESTDWMHVPYSGCSSPFQNACYQLGFEGLMESMYFEPDLIHKATDMAQPKPGPGYQEMKENSVGVLYMFQMYGGGDLFGPKQFEEFVMPAVQKALDFYHDMGFWVVYYPMGNATPHLEPMKELDWDALSLEESRKGYEIDIKQVREVMGPDRLLFGNMTTDFIDKGLKDKMVKEARYQIKSAGENGNFILSCGTPIMPGTPAENIKFFCELPKLV